MKQTTVLDFYKSLPHEAQKDFRENVQYSSGLEYYQFFYRMRRNSWSALEMVVINQYLKRRGFKLECIHNLDEPK